MPTLHVIAGSIALVVVCLAILLFAVGLGAALFLLVGGAPLSAFQLSVLVIAVSAVTGAGMGVMWSAANHREFNDGLGLALSSVLLGLVGWAFFRSYKLFVRP